MSTVSITLELDLKTCMKGHVYAIPSWVVGSFFACPMCGKLKIEQLEKKIQELEHSNASLRGVITRLKGTQNDKEKAGKTSKN